MLAPRPITALFLEEVQRQPLPPHAQLVGHPTSCAVAAHLIATTNHKALAENSEESHAAKTAHRDTQSTSIQSPSESENIVNCTSLEAFGTAVLTAFLEEKDPPTGRQLLWSVSEEQIVAYAREHGFAVVPWEHDDVRTMLDAIAVKQPQTYHSLAKSAFRLQPELFRLLKSKQDKAQHE